MNKRLSRHLRKKYPEASIKLAATLPTAVIQRVTAELQAHAAPTQGDYFAHIVLP